MGTAWLEPLQAYWQGGVLGLSGWVISALAPPLLVLAIIRRHVAPGNLAPWVRVVVLIGAGAGLAAVWIKHGQPVAARVIGL